MTCVATLARSDPKERGDERLLAVIGFPHAEHMAIRATRCVANHHHSVPEHAETDDSSFSVVLARVFRLKVGRLKDEPRVLKIKLPLGECLGALRRIVGDGHKVIVTTITAKGKSSPPAHHPPEGRHDSADLAPACPTRPIRYTAPDDEPDRGAADQPSLGGIREAIPLLAQSSDDLR